MNASQEKAYASRVNKMTREEFVEEIAKVAGTSIVQGKRKDLDRKIVILQMEDDRRDGMAYDDAMKLVMEKLGYRKHADGTIDMRTRWSSPPEET